LFLQLTFRLRLGNDGVSGIIKGILNVVEIPVGNDRRCFVNCGYWRSCPGVGRASALTSTKGVKLASNAPRQR
jgi:hypothetical protein